MKKTGFRTRNIIITSVVCSIAAVTGIALGSIFGKELFSSGPSFNSNDPLSFEDDNEKLYENYKRGKLNADKLKPHEIVNLAISKFEDSPNHYSITRGDVDAGLVVQTVDTIVARDNEQYFMESISCSKFVSVAKRFYQEGDNIIEYTGNQIDQSHLTAKWGDELQFPTTKDFETKWGKEVKRSSIYIISSKTVLEEKTSTDENGNYSITLKLNPEDSTLRYVRQIVNMSDLKDLPKFYEVEIEYTINKDFDLINRTIKENYDVNKLGTHNSTGLLKETYYVGNFTIPDLKTNCQYGGK